MIRELQLGIKSEGKKQQKLGCQIINPGGYNSFSKRHDSIVIKDLWTISTEGF